MGLKLVGKIWKTKVKKVLLQIKRPVSHCRRFKV